MIRWSPRILGVGNPANLAVDQLLGSPLEALTSFIKVSRADTKFGSSSYFRNMIIR